MGKKKTKTERLTKNNETSIERLVIEYYIEHFSEILEESGYDEFFRESYRMIEPFLCKIDITNVDQSILENLTAEDIFNETMRDKKMAVILTIIKLCGVKKELIVNLLDFGLTMGKVSVDVVAQMKEEYGDTQLEKVVIGELYFTTLASKIPKEEYLTQVDSIATAIETYIPKICDNRGLKGKALDGGRAGLKKLIMSQKDVPENAGILFDRFVKDVQDNPEKIKRLAELLREKEGEYISRFYK